MKRLLLNILLLALLSGCNVITNSQTSVGGQPVDAQPTPVESLDQVVTENPTDVPVVDEQPIPVESGDTQSGGFYQNWVAYVDANNNIAMVNPVTGEVKQVTEDGSAMMNSQEMTESYRYSSPAWSSDGTLLAFTQEVSTQKPDMVDVVMNLMVYGFEKGTSQVVLGNEYLSGYSWRPGTHMISFTVLTEPGYFTARGQVDATLAHGVMQLNVDSGETSELVAPQGFSLVQPKWSPDGNIVSFDEVYLMEGKGNFAWYDFSTSTYHSWDNPIGNYDWSPSGKILAYDNLTYLPSGDERIMTNDSINTDEKLFSTNVETGTYAFSPRYSPSGSQLAYLVGFGSLDQVNKYQLKVQAVDSSEAQILLEAENLGSFAWSGDGSFLAVTNGPYGSAEIVIIDVLNNTNMSVAQGQDPTWQK